MNKTVVSLMAVFYSLFCSSGFTQSFTNYQRRIINENLLEMVKNYEKYSRFTSDYKDINESYAESFVLLFDKNAILFNDILPLNKVSDTISVSRYVRDVRNCYTKGMGVKVQEILIHTPSYINNDDYQIEIEFKKEIYGYTNNNVNEKAKIPLMLTVGFHMTGDQVSDLHILSITGESQGRYASFKVLRRFRRKPVVGAEITLGSQIKKTDEQGKVRFENIDPHPPLPYPLKITHESYKPEKKTIKDFDDYIDGNTNYHHLRLKYDYYDPNEFIFIVRPLRFSFVPFFSCYVPGFNTIKSESMSRKLADDFVNLDNKWSFSYRFGLRAGIIVLHTRAMDFSIYAGAERSYIRTRYMFDQYHKEMDHQLDIDNDEYTKLIDLSGFEQEVKLNFTDFPLLLSIQTKNLKKFGIAGNIGVRYSLMDKHTYTLDKGELSVSGLYPQYNDLIIRDYDDYGFYKTSVSGKEMIFSVPTRHISYQAALILTKEISHSVKFYAGPTFFFYRNPLSTNGNTKELITRDEKINDIMTTYKTNKLQGITLEIGLIYNFPTLNLFNTL